VQIKIFISLFILMIISGCNSNRSVNNVGSSANEVCDIKGNKYESPEMAKEIGLSNAGVNTSNCANRKSIHYTWDMNEDGINDCEANAMCDHLEDYTLPRYVIPGIEDNIVFDKRSGRWVDKFGICHTCTPENGFKKDGAMDESMFKEDTSKWKEAMGVITDSVQTPDGNFAYTISYNVEEGIIKNSEGQLIQGALVQHIFGVKKLAVKGQTVKLRYNHLEEPMFYELLEPIKFTQ
jgi:hypothetical protein